MRDVCRERAVEFHEVDRKPPQIGERRPTGAEVVDGDRHTEILQLLEPFDRLVGPLHGDALGYLDGELGRRETVFLESAATMSTTPGSCNCLADRLTEMVGTRDAEIPPRRGLGTRHVHRCGPDRNDRPCLLGVLDERRRVKESTRGVLPAHQRLDACHASGPRAQDRLVMKGQLSQVVSEGSELALQLHP